MPTNFNIPIAVVAYNRPAPLMRLLGSLNNAIYPQEVKLIISIDKSDDKSVENLAMEFEWKHGNKELIIQEEHLGLRNHILSAGDLSSQADGIIVLEDDLFVSPYFYEYTLQAYRFYKTVPDIAGVSLYAHNYNESARLPFTPLLDGSDVFFMQIPSSWGQCWSKAQWKNFKAWLANNKEKTPDSTSGLPANVLTWPETSWKKYFFWYVIQNSRYFVYPRHSLTSNFGDPGTHYKGKELFLHTPMLTGKKAFVFKALQDSYAVYDAFCEILSNRLSSLQPLLNTFDYTCDLYGIKTSEIISTPYVLTSRKCSAHVHAFARELKPHEANIVSNIQGKDLFLANTSSTAPFIAGEPISDEKFYYFFNIRNFQIEPMAKLNDKLKALSESQQKISDSLRQKELMVAQNKNTLDHQDELLKSQVQLIHTAEGIIKSKDSSLENALLEMKSLGDKKNELAMELEKSRSGIKLLEAESKDLQQMLKQQEIYVRDLLAESTKKNLELRKQKGLLEKWQAEKAAIEEKMQVTSTRIKQMETEKTNMQMALKGKDSEIQQLTELKAVLDQLLEAKTSELTRLDSMIQLVSGQLTTSLTEMSNLKNEVTSMQDRLKKSEEQAAVMHEANSQLTIRLDKTVATNESLNKNLVNRINEIARLNVLIRKIEQSYTFKVGKAIVGPIGKIKNLVSNKKR